MAYDENANTPFPAAVLAALQTGDKIEAIKLLREYNNLGLKQAKDLIDRYPHGEPNHSDSKPNTLPPSVIEAIQSGRKIEAIRLLREASGMGLKEAKEAVEALAPQTTGGVVQSGSGYTLSWLVLLAAIGFVAYQWLKAGS